MSVLAVSIIPISSWITGVPINEPGWTIATLVFMWLLFPYHIVSLRNYSNQEVLSLVVKCYYVQLVWGFVTFAACLAVGRPWEAFQVSTMHPIGRYPVFVMGVCGGLLALRQASGLSDCENSGGNSSDDSSSDGERYPLDAWPKSYINLFPRCGSIPMRTDGTGVKSIIGDNLTQVTRSEYWTKRTFETSLHILCLTLFVALVDTVARHALGVESGIQGNFWLQLFVPYLQLEIILGLTLESPDSHVRRFLTGDVVMWCGKMSMTLYLIHMVVIYYVCLILNNWEILYWPYDYPYMSDTDCEDDYPDDDVLLNSCEDSIDEFYRKRLIPMWTIPIVIVVSLGMCPVLFYGIEEPMRKILRAKKRGGGGS